MLMKHFVTTFLLCLFVGIGNAQITINADEFIAGFSQLGSSNVTAYTIASLTGSGIGMTAKKAGAAVTWDFSPFAFTQESTASITVLAYPGGAPLFSDPDFSTATHVLKIASPNPGGQTIFEFLRIDQTGFYNLGTTSDTLGGTKLFSYVPALQQYQFPLQYQRSWNSNSTWNSPNLPSGYVVSDSIQVTVDSYGSLITPTSAHGKNGESPMASTNDALRITTKTTQTTSYSGITLTPTVTYQYEWVTNANHRVSMSADNTQKITSASYFSGTSSAGVEQSNPEQALNLCLSNNPASNTGTRLLYTMQNGGNAQVSLMDPLGREVQMLYNGYAQPGQNIIPIDPTPLAAGAYFLRVNAEGMTATRKLIITK